MSTGRAQVETPTLDEFRRTHKLLGCEIPLGEAWPGASTIQASVEGNQVNLLVLADAASWDAVLNLFYYAVALNRCRQLDFTPSLLLLPQGALKPGNGPRWCLATSCPQLTDTSGGISTNATQTVGDQMMSTCTQVAAWLAELHQHDTPIAVQDFCWVLLRMHLREASGQYEGLQLDINTLVATAKPCSGSDPGPADLQRKDSIRHNLLEAGLLSQSDVGQPGHAEWSRENVASKCLVGLPGSPGTQGQVFRSFSRQNSSTQDTGTCAPERPLSDQQVVGILNNQAARVIQRQQSNSNLSSVFQRQESGGIQRQASSSLQKQAALMAATNAAAQPTATHKPPSLDSLPSKVVEGLQMQASQQLHLANLEDNSEVTLPASQIQAKTRAPPRKVASRLSTSLSVRPPSQDGLHCTGSPVAGIDYHHRLGEGAVLQLPSDELGKLVNANRSLEANSPKCTSPGVPVSPLHAVKTMEDCMSQDPDAQPATCRRQPTRRPSCLSNASRQEANQLMKELDRDDDELALASCVPEPPSQPARTSARRLPARSASCSPSMLSACNSVSSGSAASDEEPKLPLEVVKTTDAAAQDPDTQIKPTPPPRRRPSVVRTASRLSCSSSSNGMADIEPLYCALSSQSTSASGVCEPAGPQDPDLATMRAALSSSTARRQVQRCSSRLSISTSLDLTGDKTFVKAGPQDASDMWGSNPSFRATSTCSVLDIEEAMLQNPDLLPAPLVPYRRTPTRSSSRLSLRTSNAGTTEPAAPIIRAGGSSGSSGSKKGSTSLAAALLSNVGSSYVPGQGGVTYSPASCPVLPSVTLAARFSDLPEVTLPARAVPARSSSRLSLASGSNLGPQERPSNSISGQLSGSRAGPVRRPSRLCNTTISGNYVDGFGDSSADHQGEFVMQLNATDVGPRKAWGPPSCPVGVRSVPLRAHSGSLNQDSEPPSSTDLDALERTHIGTASLVERMRAAAASSMPSPVLKQQDAESEGPERVSSEEQAPAGRRLRMKRRCSVSFTVLPIQYSNLDDVSAITARSSEPISASNVLESGQLSKEPFAGHGQALHPALLPRRLPSRTSSRLSLACSAHSSLAGAESLLPTAVGAKQHRKPADKYESLIELLKHGAYDKVLSEDDALLSLGPVHLTPGLAPEMRGATGACPTTAGDVFTFGIVLYHALSGSTTLGLGESRDALAAKMAQGWRPERPPAITDDGQWDLITACWAADPKERPTMSQVQATMQNLSKPAASSATFAGLLGKQSLSNQTLSTSLAEKVAQEARASTPSLTDPEPGSKHSAAAQTEPRPSSARASTHSKASSHPKAGSDGAKAKMGCAGCKTCSIM